MANAKTGIWSALGAVVGGVAGAMAGRYAAQARPIHSYANAPHPSHRSGIRGRDVEDAMVIGGATGAVVGAFFAGTVAGEDEPPPAPTTPQLIIPAPMPSR